MCLGKGLGLIGLTLVLAACGGGGGNAGSNPNIAVDPVVSAAIKSGSVALTLVDGAGSVVANRSLSQTDSRYLRMVLTDSRGAVAPHGTKTHRGGALPGRPAPVRLQRLSLCPPGGGRRRLRTHQQPLTSAMGPEG